MLLSAQLPTCSSGRLMHVRALYVHLANCRLPSRSRVSTHCVLLRLQTSGAHLSLGETAEHAASALQERLSTSDGAVSSAAVQEPSSAASQLVCARTTVSS